MSMQIWKHYPGYIEIRHKVPQQSIQADLTLSDSLGGRENLTHVASDADVKQEAKIMRFGGLSFQQPFNFCYTVKPMSCSFK